MTPLRGMALSLAAVVAAGCGSGGITGPEPSRPPNSVRLESDVGDRIGGGQTYNYTQASAVIRLTASGGLLSIRIDGDQFWFGDFQTPNTLNQLQPGSFTDLQRYPFHNPVKGGLNWAGEGRECNTLSGWFVVDGVTYDDGTLMAIDLRFEQHCEEKTPALRGTIHWRSDDTTGPPGPVNPVPVGLWRPAPGSTPAAGSYVYLDSDAGDFIGAGRRYTYTQGDASIAVTADGGHLSVTVNGDQWWRGDFQTMSTVSQLQPGYYADLRRYPFHNRAKGGLAWVGEGRACNTLSGWFIVDGVTYTNGILKAVDLRFEQHCEEKTPALHGAIHLDG